MSRRIDRINELLRTEISFVLTRNIKDPRLGGVISVTRVDTSHDLRNAKVLLSVMGDVDAKKAAMDGIQSAASFLRRELKERVALRYTPFLTFSLDDGLEDADHLLQLMDRIRLDDTPEGLSGSSPQEQEGAVPSPDEA